MMEEPVRRIQRRPLRTENISNYRQRQWTLHSSQFTVHSSHIRSLVCLHNYQLTQSDSLACSLLCLPTHCLSHCRERLACLLTCPLTHSPAQHCTALRRITCSLACIQMNIELISPKALILFVHLENSSGIKLFHFVLELKHISTMS